MLYCFETYSQTLFLPASGIGKIHKDLHGMFSQFGELLSGDKIATIELKYTGLN